MPVSQPFDLRLSRFEHDPEFDQAMAIYREAIPASERKPEAALRALAAEPRCAVALAVEGEAVIGFAILTRLEGVPIALLEYMAVRADRRGRGVGAALFGFLKEGLGPGATLVIEVEAETGDPAADPLRSARKAFYRRLGAHKIEGLDYILPLGDDPPPLHLLSTGPAPAAAGLRPWLRALYVEIYGQSPEDPRIEAMLRGALP
jgi:GNAT superfamily N-acetyltransferase